MQGPEEVADKGQLQEPLGWYLQGQGRNAVKKPSLLLAAIRIHLRASQGRCHDAR